MYQHCPTLRLPPVPTSWHPPGPIHPDWQLEVPWSSDAASRTLWLEVLLRIARSDDGQVKMCALAPHRPDHRRRDSLDRPGDRRRPRAAESLPERPQGVLRRLTEQGPAKLEEAAARAEVVNHPCDHMQPLSASRLAARIQLPPAPSSPTSSPPREPTSLDILM